MLRRQYQEKFFGVQNNYEIKEIEEEFSLVSELFTELNKEVLKSRKSIDVIEDYISKTKEDVDESETTHLIEGRKMKFDIYYKKFKTGFLGAGIGSLVAIYNPYIAIGSTIIGGITGWWLF
jgi:hypothetical protein